MTKPHRKEHLYYDFANSTFGAVIAVSSENGIRYLAFNDSAIPLEELLKSEFPGCFISEAKQSPRTVQKWMEAALQCLQELSCPVELPSLDPQGTRFQRTVWQHLCSIPAGETRSYLDIACAMGSPSASRAVANACASNRIAMLIPCHRVIRSDGSLHGYRWGSHIKKQLLERERLS